MLPTKPCSKKVHMTLRFRASSSSNPVLNHTIWWGEAPAVTWKTILWHVQGSYQQRLFELEPSAPRTTLSGKNKQTNIQIYLLRRDHEWTANNVQHQPKSSHTCSQRAFHCTIFYYSRNRITVMFFFCTILVSFQPALCFCYIYFLAIL